MRADRLNYLIKLIASKRRIRVATSEMQEHLRFSETAFNYECNCYLELQRSINRSLRIKSRKKYDVIEDRKLLFTSQKAILVNLIIKRVHNFLGTFALQIAPINIYIYYLFLFLSGRP